MRRVSVGIVGGGPGGLLTAYFLEQMADRPVQVTLFEASERLGGKIHTPHFAQAPPALAHVTYEAGAAEFYDYGMHDEDPLRELIAELGLTTSPMGGPAVIMEGHLLSSLEDVRDHLGPEAREALVAFDRQARDRMTPRDFFHSDYPDGRTGPGDDRRFQSLLDKLPDPLARRYLETLVHSDLATEPGRTSVDYGLQNYLMNDAAYMQLYSIVGGNQRLPRELAARIDARKLLAHRVTSIERRTDGRLRLSYTARDEVGQAEFDFIVVALPHNHLAAVQFGGERLTEAMRRHLARYDFPAHYLRITLLFERPFWRDRLSDSFWMLDRFGGCCLYDESLRTPGASHGVLGWLLGGQNAVAMSQWDDDRLIAAALDSLPPLLAAGRQYYVTGAVHRWIAAVNGWPGGLQPPPLDQRHQPEPLEHPNLFVVGDYLFDSTLNGVLDSAEYVAAWIAARLSDSV
ncbi:MAG: FAD-dependent oxidoreductase [Pirellulaceae bacterium]|nr:FAD-dependent oxidoreductase [Pirellulaceae bacterium]